MIVRRFEEDDLPGMVALFRDTIRRVNSQDYSLVQIDAWAPDEDDAISHASRLQRFKNSVTFVVEIDGVLAGYANIEADGHVDHFFVSADHQGKGVGRSLMKALEDEVPNQILYAEVSITARRFFEKMGFVVVEERHPVVRGVELTNYAMRR